MTLLSALPVGALVIVTRGGNKGKTGQITKSELVHGYLGSVFDDEPRPNATRSPDWISCRVEFDGHGAGSKEIPESWLRELSGNDI